MTPYVPDPLFLVPILAAAMLAGVAAIAPTPVRVLSTFLAVMVALTALYGMVADVGRWIVEVQ